MFSNLLELFYIQVLTFKTNTRVQMTTFENVVGDWGQEEVFSLALNPMFQLSAHERITNNHYTVFLKVFLFYLGLPGASWW